jgi:hypothetical protein
MLAVCFSCSAWGWPAARRKIAAIAAVYLALPHRGHTLRGVVAAGKDVTMGKKIPARAVRFDKISLGAAAAIRANGGEILPVEGQPGRWWFVPPLGRRWSGPVNLQEMKLADGSAIRCRPHDESVELLLDTEYQAGR